MSLRNYEKGFIKDKSINSLIVSEDVLNVETKLKKGYKLNKRNIQHNDGAQYMSYVKVRRLFNFCSRLKSFLNFGFCSGFGSFL